MLNLPARPLSAAALVIAVMLGTPATLAADHAGHAPPSATAPTRDATRAALRDLWLGHVFWVRAVVVAEIDRKPAARAAAEAAVVANAKQIAAAIAPFYGQPAADRLFEMLAGHYGAVAQYLAATDQAGKDAAYQALVANAGRIAEFLSGANPYLPKETLRGLLLAHGGHHLQQIEQLRAGKHDAEVRTWAEMTQHMYVIADALAGALAEQFPKKFG